jgi:hypothetical protein
MTNTSFENKIVEIEKLINSDLVNLLEADSYDLTGCMLNCSDNGFCTAEKNNFKCSCFAFFTGLSCDIDLRQCSDKNNKCINNSTCVELANREFECKCMPFFNGKFCESEFDLCQNETCSNNGECVEVDNVARCDCYYLYDGEKCESQTNELNIIKTISYVTAIIAASAIVLFYFFVILMDVANLFICGNSRAAIKKPRFKNFKNLNLKHLPR